MPDARVRAAIENWAPPLVSQGVDANDFTRTTGRIERWDEWLDAWTETAEQHEKLAREAEERGRSRSAGEAWVRAALCHHFAKFVWLVDLDRHERATRRAVEALRQAHRHLDPAAERLEIPYDGGLLYANLRRPPTSERPPLVLLLPGLDSTKEEFFWWEQVFLDRGMATLALDGPGQGESGLRTYIRADYETAAAAVLDALEPRSDLDLERVGAAGVSLGGYYAPRAAAGEPRIRAAAGVSGPFCFGDCWDGLPGLTREAFTHHSGGADEEEGRRRAAALDLGSVIERLEQPALLVTGRLDRIIPWQETERIAREAPNATFVLYDDGNHVCNNVPYRWRPLVADWLAEELARVG